MESPTDYSTEEILRNEIQRMTKALRDIIAHHEVLNSAAGLSPASSHTISLARRGLGEITEVGGGR